MHTSAASLRLSWSLPQALAALDPPLLFAIRRWASVRLALFTAFWLELDSPYWAGRMAAIVCQPQLGASLRKGWFRMIGHRWRGPDCRPDRVLSAGSCRLSRLARAVLQAVRVRCHCAARFAALAYPNTTELAGFMKVNDTPAAGR
jgi:hypothetical protein